MGTATNQIATYGDCDSLSGTTESTSQTINKCPTETDIDKYYSNLSISGTYDSNQCVKYQDLSKKSSISVSPSSLTFAYEGDEKTTKVSCNTSWNVSSNPSWITLSPSSGNSDATVTLIADANHTGSSSSRSGTVVFQTTDGSASCNLSATQSMGYIFTDGGSWSIAANTNHSSEEHFSFELDFRSGVSKVTLESNCWYKNNDGGFTQFYFSGGYSEGYYEETLTADGVVSIPDMSGIVSYDCSVSYRGMTDIVNSSWSAYLYAWDSSGNYLSGVKLIINFV